MKHNDGEMPLLVQTTLLTLGTVGILAGIVLAIVFGLDGNTIWLVRSVLIGLAGVSSLAMLTWHRWGWWMWLGLAGANLLVSILLGGDTLTGIAWSLALIVGMYYYLRIKHRGISTFDMFE